MTADHRHRHVRVRSRNHAAVKASPFVYKIQRDDGWYQLRLLGMLHPITGLVVERDAEQVDT